MILWSRLTEHVFVFVYQILQCTSFRSFMISICEQSNTFPVYAKFDLDCFLSWCFNFIKLYYSCVMLPINHALGEFCRKDWFSEDSHPWWIVKYVQIWKLFICNVTMRGNVLYILQPHLQHYFDIFFNLLHSFTLPSSGDKSFHLVEHNLVHKLIVQHS